MTTHHFSICQGTTAHATTLIGFYHHWASMHLPAPSIRDLGDALDGGRVIVVQNNEIPPAIVACTAVFDFTSSGWRTQVLELSATIVTPAVGGLQPHNLQTILTALRFCNQVALELLSVRDRSIITIVNTGNLQSLSNMISAQFRPVSPPFPWWIQYDLLSWASQPNTWNYFYADDATVRHNLDLVLHLDQNLSQFDLFRIDRTTQQRDDFVFHMNMKGISLALREIQDVARGNQALGLVPPPAQFIP